MISTISGLHTRRVLRLLSNGSYILNHEETISQYTFTYGQYTMLHTLD